MADAIVFAIALNVQHGSNYENIELHFGFSREEGNLFNGENPPTVEEFKRRANELGSEVMKDFVHEALQYVEFNDNLDIVDFANGSTDRMISYSGDIISTRYDDQDFLSDIDPNNIQYKFEKSNSNFLKVQQEYNKAVMDGTINPKSEFVLNNGGIDQIRNNINYDVKSTLGAYIDGEFVGEKKKRADKYKQHIDELFSTEEYKQKTLEFVKSVFDYIRSFTKDIFTLFEEKVILAQGEIISTNMVTNYLCEQGVKAVLIPALEFMRTDKNSEPDLNYIREKLSAQLEAHPGQEIYITQGFICRNAYGEIDNLQRGGSDYTASLIGAAINASEIQIWTDIDGMHDNDPRVVDKTSPVRQLHFEEAAELAYFGAKILHPTCVQPAKYANIPVRLLNTMEPSAPGTLISNETEKGKIKAVAAKDNITAIKIKSSRMLLAHGFLRKVFEIFESYQTPIDMVCTSEVGVSMSIDNTKHLNEIVNDLKKYGTVTVDHDMCIVCVVGDLEWENIGFEARAIQAMKDIPVRMISYGGSNYNISFLIRESDKKRALQALSDVLFNNK